jgi:hypothetical protein
MPDVWCLLIDRNHKPSFGEPINEHLYKDSYTIHDLKYRLKNGDNKSDFQHHTANRIEIWRCNAVKLSNKVSLTRLKELLSHVNFSDGSEEERHHDVQHLGAGQTIGEIGLEDDELLLVVVP